MAPASEWEVDEDRGCQAVLGTAHASSPPVAGLRAQKFPLQPVWGDGNYQIGQKMANELISWLGLMLGRLAFGVGLPGVASCRQALGKGPWFTCAPLL